MIGMIGQAENSHGDGWGAKEKAGRHTCCGPGRLPALQQLFRTRLGVPAPHTHSATTHSPAHTTA